MSCMVTPLGAAAPAALEELQLIAYCPLVLPEVLDLSACPLLQRLALLGHLFVRWRARLTRAQVCGCSSSPARTCAGQPLPAQRGVIQAQH